MRILFTFAGGNGHFEPLIPLATAALAAGHTVAFASGPGLRAAVTAAGFTAFAVGSGGPDNAATITALAPLDPERERRDLREGFARRATGERLPGLLALLAEWQPEVLVRDETDYAAAIAADQLGLPCATMTCMPAGGFATDEVVGGPLHEWRAAQGLPPDPGLSMVRRLVLSGLPLSFRDPADPLPATARAFRPLIPRQPTEVPDWIIPGRPAVYFTLGTIFNRESGDLFTRVLAGLRELDAAVLVTVGRQLDPADLGPQPAHVRVERYRPQAEILPHCALVVSQGGSGAVTGTLAHGLPALLLPMGADQPYNAQRCAALGFARVLDPTTATPDQVRANAAALLTDPGYARRTQEFAREIAALPGPDIALEWITALR
ncbi:MULTISPECIES: glycosyltransferase [unclassified Crossiella]|uniref:glycosyltransferase n=1 Tax=unclassified Crossiella TaxID=2620835 RepID=UPI001FFE437B|nr:MULTISPECIES: glycosyltransferase [unclassified Crossiella]MCK2238819.1 glycosyltransferase [Crossiella sp. S99.2]MCK2251611.1 glycosyltransferase [Crossiella sp. S99.1]